MTTTAPPHRDAMSVLGDILLAVSVVVVGIIIVRIALVQSGNGLDGGAAQWFRHAGYVLTTPFHGLADLDRYKSEELVNDSIAAAVYLGLGLLCRRLLR